MLRRNFLGLLLATPVFGLTQANACGTLKKDTKRTCETLYFGIDEDHQWMVCHAWYNEYQENEEYPINIHIEENSGTLVIETSKKKFLLQRCIDSAYNFFVMSVDKKTGEHKGWQTPSFVNFVVRDSGGIEMMHAVSIIQKNSEQEGISC